MKKRFLCALLCLVLFLGALPAASLAANTPAPTYDDASAAADILDGLRNDGDFAGLYLKDNGAKVVVMLINATAARKNEIRAMVQRPDVVEFKSAKYSYAELDRICFEAIAGNGTFEVTTSGLDEINNCVVVTVYYGGEAAARAYYAKKYGNRVKVIGSDYVSMGDLYNPIAVSNEQWIREVFPDAMELSTANARFVFSGAPRAVKTRAVLNTQGESLTLYRFKTQQDYEKAKAMIRGTTVVSGGKTVYVDTEFASTYFYNGASNMLALYCGSTQRTFSTLYERNFYPAGGLGGFFSLRNSAIYKGTEGRVLPDEHTPESPQALRKLSDAVCLGIVKRTPDVKGKAGEYEIAVTESIRGAAKNAIRVSAMPEVLEKGRTYMLFLVKDGASAGWRLTDNVYFSVFELNDKGYVLPVREYGMTRPVSLSTFKKGL